MTVTTTWPTGATLTAWVGPTTLAADSTALTDDLVADATATVLDRIDTDKLPTDPMQCPRAIARAIVLEAARLLSRRFAANGIASFGDFAVRLATVDADVARLLLPYRMDPEA